MQPDNYRHIVHRHDYEENWATRYWLTEVGLSGAPRSVMIKSIRFGAVISTVGLRLSISSPSSGLPRLSILSSSGAGFECDGNVSGGSGMVESV